MTRSALQVSHLLVRGSASITLIYLLSAAVCLKYPSPFCQAIAHGSVGKTLVFWTIATSVLLPPYVGLEGRWSRRLQTKSTDVWINLALALGCLVLFAGVVLYAFGHYAMF
jgi:hypothetical protein